MGVALKSFANHHLKQRQNLHLDKSLLLCRFAESMMNFFQIEKNLHCPEIEWFPIIESTQLQKGFGPEHQKDSKTYHSVKATKWAPVYSLLQSAQICHVMMTHSYTVLHLSYSF